MKHRLKLSLQPLGESLLVIAIFVLTYVEL
jgi:hypothetical protein